MGFPVVDRYGTPLVEYVKSKEKRGRKNKLADGKGETERKGMYTDSLIAEEEGKKIRNGNK